MHKTVFKKILSILDSIEIQGITLAETPFKVYEEMKKDSFTVCLEDIIALTDFLKQKQILKITDYGIDLSPTATIYSKSNQNSGLEALAIFESFIHDTDMLKFYQKQIKNNTFVSKKEMDKSLDRNCLKYLLQTALFEEEHGQLRFHQKLIQGIKNILYEYEKNALFVSVTLTALYTSSIVTHEDFHIEYKNTNAEMIAYQLKHIILSIIPRKGIPRDREETKALQAFYKDTLFHEFNHSCPICHISIGHMLIASHIKPFRDCAHIYEAIDHNNGLLLCRNHDYLFDQGYFTFDDNGKLLLCKELSAMQNLEKAYVLDKNFELPQLYMTENRRLFMKYHRENLFKK